MTIAATEHLKELIRQELDGLIAIRRDLHAHPEIMYEEHRTSGVVQRELERAAVPFVAGLAGGTGVLGHLPGTSERAIGLRADMDALPIEEETDLPYRSTIPGKMHACGHDGHTTILLGAARVLARLAAQQPLPHPVTFVFQPAEEGGGGGRRMVEDGCLTGAKIGAPVAGMYGLHGWPNLALHHVGTRSGPLLAAADSFKIIVRGRGGHAAFPHFAQDTVLTASQIVTALQSIVSRNTSPLDSLVVSVTQIHGGTTHNILPGEVRLEGTVRTLRTETQTLAKRRLAEISRAIAEAGGCSAELVYTEGYPVTRNDDAAAKHVAATARDMLGAGLVHLLEEPFMGAEDFSFYCEEVPSCFFILGLLRPGMDQMPGLHHPRFDFTDEAIATGVELFCRLALAEQPGHNG